MLNRIRIVVVAVALAFFAQGLAAQDSRDESRDPRREKLLFGIDSEVLSVLDSLKTEGFGTYNDLLVEIMAETRDNDILNAIYRLWDETRYDGGLETARRELEKVTMDEDFDKAVVGSAMTYIASRSDEDSLPVLAELTDYRDSTISAAAVRALGSIGAAPSDEVAQALLERLQDEDPIAEEDLVSALIVTLGKIAFEPAADELAAIAEDAGANAGHRRLACVSLGSIGRAEDFDVVSRIYFDEGDAMLRAYALSSLAQFPDQNTTPILIQALKRDSFWRIRVTAAENLEDAAEARELLRYKAVNDPVNQVRVASVKSLAVNADSESREFLLDYYTNNTHVAEVRLAALSAAVENQLSGTNDAVTTVMDELWEKDERRFLEYTCRDLSRADWSALETLYSRMLDHENWLLKVYGIRGIRRNDISSLAGRISAMAEQEGLDARIKREIDNGLSRDTSN